MSVYGASSRLSQLAQSPPMSAYAMVERRPIRTPHVRQIRSGGSTLTVRAM
jgi:hypothetical protein